MNQRKAKMIRRVAVKLAQVPCTLRRLGTGQVAYNPGSWKEIYRTLKKGAR